MVCIKKSETTCSHRLDIFYRAWGIDFHSENFLSVVEIGQVFDGLSVWDLDSVCKDELHSIWNLPCPLILILLENSDLLKCPVLMDAKFVQHADIWLCVIEICIFFAEISGIGTKGRPMHFWLPLNDIIWSSCSHDYDDNKHSHKRTNYTKKDSCYTPVTPFVVVLDKIDWIISTSPLASCFFKINRLEVIINAIVVSWCVRDSSFWRWWFHVTDWSIWSVVWVSPSWWLICCVWWVLIHLEISKLSKIL